MDRVQWCERGRRVNWVRCDTFNFGLLILKEQKRNLFVCRYVDLRSMH